MSVNARELSAQTQARLIQLMRRHLAFHLVSWLIALITVSVLFSLAFFWPPSLLLAGGLSLFFFELLAYAILSFNLVEQRKAQLVEIGQSFRDQIDQLYRSFPDHAAKSGSQMQDLAHQLHDVHWRLIPQWNRGGYLRDLAMRLSAWWHAVDTRALREWLLLNSAEYQMKGVRTSPLDIDSHAQLAMICIDLADLWIPRDPKGEECLAKAARVSMFLQVALEELIILSEIAPPTPELYQKMASCHCRLGDKEKQAENFQLALALDPERIDLRLQLGQLYFALGQQRKGLQVVAHLKERGDQRGEDLLQHYGAQRVFSLDTQLDLSR